MHYNFQCLPFSSFLIYQIIPFIGCILWHSQQYVQHHKKYLFLSFCECSFECNIFLSPGKQQRQIWYLDQCWQQQRCCKPLELACRHHMSKKQVLSMVTSKKKQKKINRRSTETLKAFLWELSKIIRFTALEFMILHWINNYLNEPCIYLT